MYYHGRAGSQDLRDDVVIQWSESLDTAKQYAGRNGSIWKLGNTQGFLSATEAINLVRKELDSGARPEWFDEFSQEKYETDPEGVLEEINPKNIVDSAGWWDDPTFVFWFIDAFDMQDKGVILHDGVVTFSPEAGSPVKLNADIEEQTTKFLKILENAASKIEEDAWAKEVGSVKAELGEIEAIYKDMDSILARINGLTALIDYDFFPQIERSLTKARKIMVKAEEVFRQITKSSKAPSRTPIKMTVPIADPKREMERVSSDIAKLSAKIRNVGQATDEFENVNVVGLVRTGHENSSVKLVNASDLFEQASEVLRRLFVQFEKHIPESKETETVFSEASEPKLNKPMRGDVKKYKVFVKDPDTGNVKKVNFGDPNMKIKRDDPERRKSFRARHKCDTAKDKTTPRYWSCKFWSKKPVSKILGEEGITESSLIDVEDGVPHLLNPEFSDLEKVWDFRSVRALVVGGSVIAWSPNKLHESAVPFFIEYYGDRFPWAEKFDVRIDYRDHPPLVVATKQGVSEDNAEQNVKELEQNGNFRRLVPGKFDLLLNGKDGFQKQFEAGIKKTPESTETGIEKTPENTESKLQENLEDWENEWVRYTDEDHLFINKKPWHQDPAGIYFFPKSFKSEGSWHRTNKYIITAKLKHEANVLDLGKISLNDKKDIYRKLQINPEPSLEKQNEFWSGLRNNYHGKQIKFANDLRRIGYDAIFDDTKTIHSAEIQLIILDPKFLEVLSIERTIRGTDLIEDLKKAIKKEFSDWEISEEKFSTRREYGKKVPQLKFILSKGDVRVDVQITHSEVTGRDYSPTNAYAKFYSYSSSDSYSKNTSFEVNYGSRDRIGDVENKLKEHAVKLNNLVLDGNETNQEIHNESLNIKPIKWSYPSEKELQDEFHEGEIDNLLLPMGYPKPEERKEAFEFFKSNLKEIEIDPKDLDTENSWRFKFPDYKTFRTQVKGYGGPKDPDSMVRKIQAGGELPMPVVVRMADGSLKLAGGATRTAIANLSGQKIKALVIDETKALQRRIAQKKNSIANYISKSKNPDIKELNQKIMHASEWVSPDKLKGWNYDDIDEDSGFDGHHLGMLWAQIREYEHKIDQGSKAGIDETIAYHGTNRSFAEFDPKAATRNATVYGPGVYLTQDNKEASDYAGEEEGAQVHMVDVDTSSNKFWNISDYNGYMEIAKKIGVDPIREPGKSNWFQALVSQLQDVISFDEIMKEGSASGFLVKQIQSLGYAGVEVPAKYTGGKKGDWIVVYDPKAMKHRFEKSGEKK